MAEAPTVDETLKPDDIVDMLEELLPAKTQSFVLGLKLKIPLDEVDAIHCQYLDPMERLLHILLSFTRQKEPRPTWRIIVDALRSRPVNLPRLAMQVEAVRCRDVVPGTPTDTDSTANPTVAGDGVPSSQLSTTTAKVPSSQLSTTTAKVPSSQLSPVTGSVEAVRKEICQIQSRFNSLKDKTIESLEKCRIAVITVVYILSNVQTHEDRLFQGENLKDFCQCEHPLELFGHLNFYWNYLAYDLLDHMITELAKKHTFFQSIAGEMAVYKKDLQVFRKFTPLVLFCEADPRILDEDPPPGFRRKVIEFDWPEKVTLEDVENFRRRYAKSYDLKTIATMLNNIMAG